MYTHLTKETRIKFSALLQAGVSLRRAAKLLDCHHATLSRELRRNPPVSDRWRYNAGDAQRRTARRRHSANQRWRRILPDSPLERLLVVQIRDKKFAPEQCAGWLRRHRPAQYVCAQTIYDWLYGSKPELAPYLHCAKGKYRHTRQSTLRKQRRAQLAAVRNIANRPAHVALRKTYGHWEGDTVHGLGKSGYIATFVERKSGYLLAEVLPDCTSASFAAAASRCLSRLPANYRKTLTLDNGPEMKLPERIERATGTTVYYANPYHSWERGTNENTNGLLRYFFPKKSSFATLIQERLDEAVHLLNTRPRKRHDWRTPAEMLKV